MAKEWIEKVFEVQSLIFVATASASRSDGSFSSGGIGIVVRINNVKSLYLAPFLKHDGF